MMFWAHEGLQQRLEAENAKDNKDLNLIADIQAALYCNRTQNQDAFDHFRTAISQSKTSFDFCWSAFRPNTLVYSYDLRTSQDRVLIVRSSNKMQRQDRSIYLEVNCDVIHDSGLAFGYASDKFEIDQFPGTKPIQTLPVYPLDFCFEKKRVLAQAIERGKRFARLPTHGYFEMSGQAFRQVYDRKGEIRDVKFYVCHFLGELVVF
jgi:hypothetical protein